MRNKFMITLIFLVAMAVSAQADTVVTGYIADADHVNVHTFNVSNAGVVSFQFVGTFDSVFSLFNGAGNHLITNDDSPSGQTASHITQFLQAGTYSLSVGVCCSFASASDSALFSPTDGFNEGTFWVGGPGTLVDGFTNWGCEVNCSGDYSVIVTTSENTSVAAVPEPTSLLLLGTGFVGIARRFRKA